VTYNVIVVDDLAIKEAVGGERLLDWMKNKRVENLTMFALSFCVNSVARHLCRVTDRHPNNIKITPERNEFVNIDNKFALDISKPYGLDTHGAGMLPGLHDFFGDALMQEIKSTALEVLGYLRISHLHEIIKLGNIIFSDLAPGSHVTDFLAAQMENEAELLESFSVSFMNTTKHTIQVLKSL
jgi:hypothetical protein